jgi:hypothetical protein
MVGLGPPFGIISSYVQQQINYLLSKKTNKLSKPSDHIIQNFVFGTIL